MLKGLPLCKDFATCPKPSFPSTPLRPKSQEGAARWTLTQNPWYPTFGVPSWLHSTSRGSEL